MANRKKIIIVLGPTCTGKSALAMEIAEEIGGEVINADSMQVYRQFDIGTAKPDSLIRQKIPHHLIDVVAPDGEFDAATFKRMADLCIKAIMDRGQVPIVVGGTGLYIKALLYGLFPAQKDERVRAFLEERYIKDKASFYNELKKIDPGYAKQISVNDRIRNVRAMEVYMLTGVTPSEWKKVHGFKKSDYDALKIGLKRERNELYRRINERVDAMLEAGWVAEVKRLMEMGYNLKTRPFSGIGYKEIAAYLNGAMTYEDMVKDIKRQTRRYAKRQLTWFSKENGIYWYEYPEGRGAIIERVKGFIGHGGQ